MVFATRTNASEWFCILRKSSLIIIAESQFITAQNGQFRMVFIHFGMAAKIHYYTYTGSGVFVCVDLIPLPNYVSVIAKTFPSFHEHRVRREESRKKQPNN